MRRRTIVIVVVLVLSIISACNSAPTTTICPGMEQTLAVRTMVARQGVTFFTTPTPTLTPIPPQLNNSSNHYIRFSTGSIHAPTDKLSSSIIDTI